MTATRYWRGVLSLALTIVLGARLCRRHRTRANSRLSRPADQDDRRIRRRRQHRRCRQDRGAEDVGSSRPVGSGREPPRRQRAPRRRGRREIAARRLHADDGEPDRARGGAASLSQGDGRSDQRFCSRGLLRSLAAGAGRQPVISGAHHGRSDRHGQGQPGKIIFGTGGAGTTPHIASEMFQYAAGIKMTHVPYRGEAGAINDLVAGQIPAMFANLSAIMGQLKAGTVRAIAVTSPQRSPLAPDVPTVAETLPGYAAETWFGLIAPAGTPHDVIAKLNTAALQALASAGHQKALCRSRHDQQRRRRHYARTARCLYEVRGRQMGESHQGRQYPADGLSISLLPGIPVRLSALGGSLASGEGSGVYELVQRLKARLHPA